MLFQDKTILVTGGTGSMGKTFVRRVLSGEEGIPKKLIVFSRDEAKQHAMRMEYQNRVVATDETIYNNFKNVLEFRIGDVRSYHDVCASLRGVDIVVNAAALKQVPTCEYFPEQALATNCQGPENIVRAIREHAFPIETVIAISTDKACKPVNAMGITKALQERIFIAANIFSQTRFIGVRYGNVLASRGSVIPLFHEQIRNGGPVSITVPGMTRFLMSIHEAVSTVFAALAHALPGEIFVPIAPSSTVLDIAKALIGNMNIPIKTIGIRPGEKIHEILISEEESSRSVTRGNYYAIRPMLPELCAQGHDEGKTLLPTFNNGEYSSEHVVLSLDETRTLLNRHKLLFDPDRPSGGFGEMIA